MLYPYAEFPGTLIVTYSQELKDGTIFVHFEQPCDGDSKKLDIFYLANRKFIVKVFLKRK